MSAATAEVVRRQADGTWKYVIDNPDAAGVLGELTPDQATRRSGDGTAAPGIRR